MSRPPGQPACDAVPDSMIDGTPSELRDDLVRLLGKKRILDRARPAHHVRTGLIGENGMRSVLALCLLIALCAAANATARGHHAESRHVIVRPSQAVIPSYATPGGVRIYRDQSVPGGLRTDHDDPPAYDDPSKFGGG
jgi:hypothetical protein